MTPILFSIGPYNAYTFGFFLGLAFLFSTFIIYLYAKEEFKEESYLDTYLYTGIIALFFSRLTYILTHPNEFGLNFLKYVVVRDTPGISLIGGGLGALAFLFLYCRKKKLDFIGLADIFSIAISSALFLAKIGEQLGGAAYGKNTLSAIGVRIIGLSGRYHPVELYESTLFLLLTIILIWLKSHITRKKWGKGLLFYIFIECSALIYFIVEFFKVSRVYLYGLSIRQLFAILIILSMVFPIIRKVREIRNTSIS